MSALADLSDEEHLGRLAEFVATWSQEDGLPRRLLEEELPGATGFHPAVVRAGLAHAWADFTDASFLRSVGSRFESGSRRFTGFRDMAVILAGALPMPTWSALLLPLVMRTEVRAKPARHDPVSAAAFREALEATSPAHAACVSVHDLSGPADRSWHSFLDADCVVAYGNDETIRDVGARVPGDRRFVGHGHRESFAVVGEASGEAQIEQTARSIAFDVALWDQLGCLSPREVYVHRSVVDPLMDALADAFVAIEEELPRGLCAVEVRVAFGDALAEARFRAATQPDVRVASDSESRWAVVRDNDDEVRPHPLHRFLRLHPFDDLSALLRRLGPLRGSLAALGIAGFGADTTEVAGALARLAPSRICPVGRMQAPALDWSHGNWAFLHPVGAWTDLEGLDRAI